MISSVNVTLKRYKGDGFEEHAWEACVLRFCPPCCPSCVSAWTLSLFPEQPSLSSQRRATHAPPTPQGLIAPRFPFGGPPYTESSSHYGVPSSHLDREPLTGGIAGFISVALGTCQALSPPPPPRACTGDGSVVTAALRSHPGLGRGLGAP